MMLSFFAILVSVEASKEKEEGKNNSGGFHRINFFSFKSSEPKMKHSYRNDELHSEPHV